MTPPLFTTRGVLSFCVRVRARALVRARSVIFAGERAGARACADGRAARACAAVAAAQGRKLNLDALLDSALDGFDDAEAAVPGAGPVPAGLGPGPALAESPSGAGAAAAAAATATAIAAADAGAEASAASVQAAEPQASGTPSAAAREADGAAGAGDADIGGMDELAKGLARLFEETAGGGGGSGGESGDGGGGFAEDDLMRTLQQLAEGAGDGAAGGGSADEADARALEEMLGALGAGLEGGDGGAGGDGAEMAGLMESMMHALLSKDVLQQPMSEIADKYPRWIDANRATLSASEVEMYEKQLALVRELLVVYDEAPEDMPRIARLMEEMQSLGQPPEEIVSDLVPGVEFQDGAPVLPDLGAQAGMPPGACTIM